MSHTSTSAIDQEKHPWRFLGGTKDKKETFETAMQRLVKKEMGIKIENIVPVKDTYFHAKLTDDHVNNIQRSDNQLFAFFTVKEVQKLFLSFPTQEFMEHYKSTDSHSIFAQE